MTERIYIKVEQGEVTPVDEEPFLVEAELQALIAKHPDLLAGEQVCPDDPRRWMLVDREKGIVESSDTGNSWALDLLIVDQDAVPTLVEVKRGSNREIRRTIIGQMLEYAADAARTWTEAELRHAFEESANSRELDPREELANLLQKSEPDIDSFWKHVATNLEARRFRLLFVADDIPDPLKRVVEFLNVQMPDIEVLAVEIKQFRNDSIQTLVPRVIGRTAALPSRGTVRSPKLTRQTFLDSFLDKSQQNTADLFLKHSEKLECKLKYADKSVSIRKTCSVWPDAIMLARLHIPDDEWYNARAFSFTVEFDTNDPYPEKLRVILDQWLDKFSNDSFATDRSGKGHKTWAVRHDDAVCQIDLLKERLDMIVGELKALQNDDDGVT